MKLHTKFKHFLHVTHRFKAGSEEPEVRKSLDHVKYKNISDNDEVTNLKADFLNLEQSTKS